MKRLHLHIGVDNLDASIRFYSALFSAQPVKVKEDYAKWMLDDPRINFAISTRSGKKGLDHLGLQVDDLSELEALRAQLSAANLSTHDEGETTCCYARSEKSWVTAPEGTAWEAYHTMADAAYFNADEKTGDTPKEAACCAPQIAEPAATKTCC
jgi:catechol 2,3-dioxygenase-like lactoylglutathione lyase family enzyme